MAKSSSKISWIQILKRFCKQNLLHNSKTINHISVLFSCKADSTPSSALLKDDPDLHWDSRKAIFSPVSGFRYLGKGLYTLSHCLLGDVSIQQTANCRQPIIEAWPPIYIVYIFKTLHTDLIYFYMFL